MRLHLDQGVSEICVEICDSFARELRDQSIMDHYSEFVPGQGSFDTARQIGTVYELFAGEDLQSLLNGFVDQARAMSMLFAAAGGLIESQDEALAEALGKASTEPAGLQSLGLMGSLSMTSPPGLDLPEASLPALGGGYGRVGPEDVSAATLERMASGARALDEAQFRQVATRVRSVADTLEGASGQLQSGLDAVLGGKWQGEFATRATSSVTGLTTSATELAGALREVGGKADGAADGFTVTRQNVGSEASTYELVQQRTPGSGLMMGPASATDHQAMAAARAAAEEQARAVMNTEYSPAVMDANLSGLDFPTAYRVVSSAGLGGPNGVDLANVWNDDGVIRPASPGAPSEAAIATVAGGGAAGGDGHAETAGTGGASAGATPHGGAGATMPVDAGTEQALLGSREGVGAGTAASGGLGGAGGGTGTGTGGVNAGTAAAAAGSPLMAPGTSQSGGAAGTAGVRASGRSTSTGSDRSDRGFGSAAGLVGGGGAAAAGAGAASRMGGAGTLSGLGGPGSLAAPPATGTGVAGAAGAASSSSTGAAGAGRMGAMPMGMMGAGGAAGRNDRSEGHRPASYLVNATNASEIVGEPVKVSPAKIGALPDAAPAPEPTPAPVSPAQALVNKLKGR